MSVHALSVLLAVTAFGCETKTIRLDGPSGGPFWPPSDCYSLVPSSFAPVGSGSCDPPAGGSGWQAVLTPAAPHVIDGRFTGREWDHVPPLQGQYTDVYVDLRDGNLYLLNDWHVNDEGSPEGCFNLFALKIGERRVEIRVFSERIEVDGLDVTGEGTGGFGSSARYQDPHTMWEFRIPFASTSDVIVCAHDPASYSACLAPPIDPSCASQPQLTSEPTVFTIAADGSRVRRSVPPSVPRVPEGGECGIDRGVCEDGSSCDAVGGVRRCRLFDWPAASPTCDDGVLGGTETDVDCGGDCAGCRAGALCVSSSDCESEWCQAGRCADASCSDGVLDGMETDVDCGGDCTGCGAGALCRASSDCASAWCEAGRCLESTFPCGAGECAAGVSYCRAISDTLSECVDAPSGCSSCECLPIDGCSCDDSVPGEIHVDCIFV